MPSNRLATMPPDPNHVTEIMGTCNCNEEEAVNLLVNSNNDPEQAKARHQTLMKYYRPAQTDSESDFTDEDVLPTPSTSTRDDSTPRFGQRTSPSEGPEDCVAYSMPKPDCVNGTVDDSRDIQQDQYVLDLEKPSITIVDPMLESPGYDPVPPPNTAPVVEVPEPKATEVFVEVAPIQPKEKPEWDFMLPFIHAPATLIPGAGESPDGFDVYDLVGALQHGANLQVIQNYLEHYDKEVVSRRINASVEGIPAMFYVVATNNQWVVRTWIEYGGDMGAVHEESGTPLLAFAIMHSETLRTDTTLVVATLLSLGAAPCVIPPGLYTPYCRDLPDYKPHDPFFEGLSDEHKAWCTPSAMAKLARTVNLTQRYHLERASKIKKPSVRHRQIAERRNAEALLGIPYLLIGQTAAANRLLTKLLSHLMLPGKRPLVLVFAGPSGHGKTELARQLGYILSLPLQVVDCTIFRDERELFGPRHPYVGAEQGSPLNNFLVANAGQRCIVFLDEFEKTSRDIHQSLLLPFDNGEYQDRRDSAKIDCSKTIWILATNALDQKILDFCDVNRGIIFSDEEQDKKAALMKGLSKVLKEEFLSRFQAPITGRVSAFLPFLTFSPGEQAVVVHKFLLELGQKGRTPINLSYGPNEQLLGNVQLRIRRDAAVCGKLADAEYHPELGARSLINGVKNVEDMMVEAYLDINESIVETDGLVDFVVYINGGEVVANIVTEPPAGSI